MSITVLSLNDFVQTTFYSINGHFHAKDLIMRTVCKQLQLHFSEYSQSLLLMQQFSDMVVCLSVQKCRSRSTLFWALYWLLSRFEGLLLRDSLEKRGCALTHKQLRDAVICVVSEPTLITHISGPHTDSGAIFHITKQWVGDRDKQNRGPSFLIRIHSDLLATTAQHTALGNRGIMPQISYQGSIWD